MEENVHDFSEEFDVVVRPKAKAKAVIQEAVEEDLKQILTEFWLKTVNGDEQAAEFPDRMKASECLAKYILGEGKTTIRRRSNSRPSTKDILQLASELEKEDDTKE